MTHVVLVKVAYSLDDGGIIIALSWWYNMLEQSMDRRTSFNGYFRLFFRPVVFSTKAEDSSYCGASVFVGARFVTLSLILRLCFAELFLRNGSSSISFLSSSDCI